VQRWTNAIAQSDGFVFVTPEYNYGTPRCSRTRFDWVYPEWNRKVAGFVSYGSVMGGPRRPAAPRNGDRASARPIAHRSTSLSPPCGPTSRAAMSTRGLAELATPANTMIADLLMGGPPALKTARVQAS